MLVARIQTRNSLLYASDEAKPTRKSVGIARSVRPRSLTWRGPLREDVGEHLLDGRVLDLEVDHGQAREGPRHEALHRRPVDLDDREPAFVLDDAAAERREAL